MKWEKRWENGLRFSETFEFADISRNVGHFVTTLQYAGHKGAEYRRERQA